MADIIDLAENLPGLIHHSDGRKTFRPDSTELERQLARDMAAYGYTTKEIADALRRSYSAVRDWTR